MNSGTDDIRNFAEGLWQYFLPKIEQKNADSVRYYRAQVTANNGDGTLTIQRPYDNAITVPCVESMKNAAVGSQVTVLVFGGTAIKNSVVVADGKFSAIGGGGGSSIDLPVSVANGGTGATTASDARNNLGLGALATKDSVKASEISGVFSISQGGTGATDASSARTALTVPMMPKLLWSGSLAAGGSITVPNFSDYSIFAFEFYNSLDLVTVYSNVITIGHYALSTDYSGWGAVVGAKLSVSGNTLTMKHTLAISNNGTNWYQSATSPSYLAITKIYGLVRTTDIQGA